MPAQGAESVRMVEDELVFFVNGKKVVEKTADPETTLLVYLRRKLGLKGTKHGCGAGDCGACTVMLSRFDRLQNKVVHSSANACLIPICALHHVAVTTVEGIGSTETRLHPVQERISKSHGSQCGFCTPGIVMSMYTLLRNNPEPSMEEIENTLKGNYCRCTGYRPILEGFRTFAKDVGCCEGKGKNPNCCLNEQKDNSVILSPSLFSPEEFLPLDPTQEPIFPPELLQLRDAPRRQLRFQGERVLWIQVATLEELLDLKAQHPAAVLVVGNTRVGIEMKFDHKVYPVLVCPAWIPELNAVEHGTEGISFGASCTLSSMEETLAAAVAKLPAHKTAVFQGILEQLRWFSGKQIKSVASIGGNVMAASPASDLNPLFMASGAKLTLVSKGKRRTIRMDHTFYKGSRKTILTPEEILLSIQIPYSGEDEYFSAFKQISRHDVTCGMRVLFKQGTMQVQELEMSFGGLGDRILQAPETSRKQTGRDWDESLLADVCAGLEEEFRLAPDAPGGMVEFRRTLTLSFFFKFYLTVLLKLNKKSIGEECGNLDPTCVSATARFHKDPPANVQLFQEVPRGQSEEDMVGRPLPHLAAARQACGEAVYCDDIPLYSNELYLRLVTSTKAHARIKSIDTSEAQNVPGFECFLSADDIPGSNITGMGSDETVFAKDEVTCIGHIIGAVVADTPEHAQRAARAVKIAYEELPAIISMEDALKKNSFYDSGPLLKIEKGDLQKGFADAEHILEGEVYMGGQEHYYLETQCTIAVPKGEEEEMELFVSTQNINLTQRFVAKVLGVPLNRIVIRVKRLGGGFGGKESRNTLLSTVVALAAHRTGRPVRSMLDRDEDMLVMGGRHPFMARYKVGFMKNGKVVALEVDHYSNAGNSIDFSKRILESAVFNMDNCYKIPNIRGTGKLCKTNLPSNTAFRGFGSPQGMFIAESWMSEIAVKCGLPPEEVRRLNMYEDGDLTHYNQKLEGFTLPRCWSECLESSQYHARRREIETFNRENSWKKRGLAIIPLKFSIGKSTVHLNQAGALVHVYTDGSVLLTHGGIEIGQGLHTKVIQIASRVLGIPMSKIYTSETSSNKVPNPCSTSASTSTDLYGMAVQAACKTLLERLQPFKDQNPNGSWEDWVTAAYLAPVSLSATGFYSFPNLGYNFETNSGNRFFYFCFGVACSEVEIDCLTGDYQNIRTDIVMDVGTSLNPAIDIGQVEGAFVQGLGLFTLEELLYSPEGSLLTRGLSSYKIPACGDIPTNFHVTLLRDCPSQKGIYASKAVGEPPLFLASSIFFAIKDAIGAARAQRSKSQLDPLFQLDSPATPERIRNACVDRFTKLCGTEVPANVKPWCKRV
ncbi:xanthine dehydrogenase/oxidase-like [Tachyglossus aculeatus]|uniref:xanthine dehydrogenase/oxidase-like n=1 Tax=Tachyglossus aculeatus TaxID=9261 RepID=UPI0018F79D76|nr:xanthine dehydrogenase/oxidase-like [Tachyglossus aculeatus]